MSQITTERAVTFLKDELVRTPLETDLYRARSLAHLLDSKFNVAGFKFGLNGIVGLLPIAGDTITTAAGVYPIFVAWKHDLGGAVMGKMAANLGIQWVIGLLPWVGDYAEVMFKANLRNLKVLESAVSRKT